MFVHETKYSALSYMMLLSPPLQLSELSDQLSGGESLRSHSAPLDNYKSLLEQVNTTRRTLGMGPLEVCNAYTQLAQMHVHQRLASRLHQRCNVIILSLTVSKCKGQIPSSPSLEKLVNLTNHVHTAISLSQGMP